MSTNHQTSWETTNNTCVWCLWQLTLKCCYWQKQKFKKKIWTTIANVMFLKNYKLSAALSSISVSDLQSWSIAEWFLIPQLCVVGCVWVHHTHSVLATIIGLQQSSYSNIYRVDVCVGVCGGGWMWMWSPHCNYSPFWILVDHSSFLDFFRLI